MSDTNFDARVFYNEGDENYNNPDGFSPEAERLLTRLLVKRGTKQLAEYRRLMEEMFTFEVEIFRDWEEAPEVARSYQSAVAEGGAKVGELETLDVKASGGSHDLEISFEEKEMDGDGPDPEIDDIPFL